MKLPWVSRVRLESSEAMCDLLRRDLAYARSAVEESRGEFKELLELYHSLRSAGASPTGPGLKPEPEPHAPSDIAIEQVVERFGGNLRLRRKLLQFQAEARRRNADEGEIADAITVWKDPDEDAA